MNEVAGVEVLERRFPSMPLAVGAVLFTAGCLWVVMDSIAWYYGQQYFAIYDQQSILGQVLRYYVAEALAIGVAVIGAYIVFRKVKSGGESGDPESIRQMLADSLSTPVDLKVGVIVALVYGAVYLVVSSILVFQPSVDFATAYGVVSPSWTAAACCGSVGTIPALIVYVSPQAHLALQILPLDALFAVIVPMLVGFNATVAVHAFRRKEVRTNVGWISSIGILAGLFTGCPTCAGLFLASAVGGLGATSLAVALAPYQILFVLVSIPLLVASPLAIASSARRAIRAACPVPLPSAS